MNTASKWGGYSASFFILVCGGMGMVMGISNLPDWLSVLIPSSFVLATLSGAVCLAAAFLHWVKRSRESKPPVTDAELQKGAV